MKKYIVIASLFGSILVSHSQTVIKTKDGKTYEGVLLEHSEGQAKLKIDSALVVLPSSTIESIEKSKAQKDDNVYDLGVGKVKASAFAGFFTSHVFSFNAKAHYGFTKSIAVGLEAELVRASFYGDNISNGEPKIGHTQMGGYTQLPITLVGKWTFFKGRTTPYWQAGFGYNALLNSENSRKFSNEYHFTNGGYAFHHAFGLRVFVNKRTNLNIELRYRNTGVDFEVWNMNDDTKEKRNRSHESFNLMFGVQF